MHGLAALLSGRYLMGKVIAVGGMGAVYHAVDRELERPVAVKVIACAADDPEVERVLRLRFRREARAAAQIHHPKSWPCTTTAPIRRSSLIIWSGTSLRARISRGGFGASGHWRWTRRSGSLPRRHVGWRRATAWDWCTAISSRGISSLEPGDAPRGPTDGSGSACGCGNIRIPTSRSGRRAARLSWTVLVPLCEPI